MERLDYIFSFNQVYAARNLVKRAGQRVAVLDEGPVHRKHELIFEGIARDDDV
jgi:hypothetical protein